MTPEVIERARRMLEQGATLHQVALVLEVSVKTLYRYIPAAEQRQLKESGVSVVSEATQRQPRDPALQRTDHSGTP